MDENLKSLFESERSLFLDYVQTRIFCVCNNSMLSAQEKMYLYGLLVSLADVGEHKLDIIVNSKV